MKPLTLALPWRLAGLQASLAPCGYFGIFGPACEPPRQWAWRRPFHKA
jgi:hypothetical protein